MPQTSLPVGNQAILPAAIRGGAQRSALGLGVQYNQGNGEEYVCPGINLQRRKIKSLQGGKVQPKALHPQRGVPFFLLLQG